MELNKSHNPSTVYLTAIENVLPKVISMLDREPFSKTFGCADRVFWSWKFIDFSGARFQEIAYVLATISQHPDILSRITIQNTTVLQWTKAAIAYWCTLQHRDGSFDEAYPYERSLAATAFTGFYVGQAFLKIKHTYSVSEQSILIQKFKAAGDWLCRNDERHGVLSNHLAAAAAALQTIAEITNDNKYALRSEYFVNKILQHQSQEGWYEEYGGADPGYQTHTTFYLAYVFKKTNNQLLLDSLMTSIKYFWNFVHVDGSIGGEYGSRNTRFFMPAGFEMLAVRIPEAAAVANFMRGSLQNQYAVGLHAMDTYNVFPLLNNYFFAHAFAANFENKILLSLPFNTLGVKKYDKSGHVILQTPSYQAIIGTAKGGVLAAFSKKNGAEEPQWSNAGVAMEFMSGKKATSQGLQCSKIKSIANNSIEIDSRFTVINQVLMSPEKFMIFRLVNLTSIFFPAFAYHLKKLLVKVLVRRKKTCPARLLRKINWSDNNIQISDQITLEGKEKVKTIRIGGRFSAIHMGSSRYFEWQELAHKVLADALSDEQIKILNDTRILVINNTWSVA